MSAGVGLRPVFIGGCERSGTTLVGSLLGAHPDCLETPESQFKTDVWASLSDPERSLDASAKRLVEHWRFTIWNLDVDASTLPRTTYADQVLALVRAYGRMRGRDGTVWVDHSPNNIRAAMTLSTIFPDARFVHVVRDGRAVAASAIPLDWGPNTAWQAARWWPQRLVHGLALEQALPDRVVRVRFEDLVTDPAGAVERLCGALDLSFDASMLRPASTRVPRYTAKQHRLVGRAPEPGRADAFREEMSARAVEIFEADTYELLSYLGYRLDYGGRARPATRFETARAIAFEGWRRIGNRLRWRRRRARATRSRDSDESGYTR